MPESVTAHFPTYALYDGIKCLYPVSNSGFSRRLSRPSLGETPLDRPDPRTITRTSRRQEAWEGGPAAPLGRVSLTRPRPPNRGEVTRPQPDVGGHSRRAPRPCGYPPRRPFTEPTPV